MLTCEKWFTAARIALLSTTCSIEHIAMAVRPSTAMRTSSSLVCGETPAGLPCATRPALPAGDLFGCNGLLQEAMAELETSISFAQGSLVRSTSPRTSCPRCFLPSGDALILGAPASWNRNWTTRRCRRSGVSLVRLREATAWPLETPPARRGRQIQQPPLELDGMTPQRCDSHVPLIVGWGEEPENSGFSTAKARDFCSLCSRGGSDAAAAPVAGAVH